MTRIELKNVNFEYPLYEVAQRSLKVSLIDLLRGSRDGPSSVHAIKDLSISIQDGERVGLVGRNGAGKSSLLRLLSGIAFPTSGTIKTHGRIVPVNQTGLGINPEFSAADNIELPLRFIGATTEEIEVARRGVREFADLGEFFDLPVRRYSDGMKARLTFALSTSIPADVLVLDEWLSAGDAEFVSRAERRINEYIHRIKVVILASHSMELLRTVCTRVIWMEKGELIADGEPNEVIDAYLAKILEQPLPDQDKKIINI